MRIYKVLGISGEYQCIQIASSPEHAMQKAAMNGFNAVSAYAMGGK